MKTFNEFGTAFNWVKSVVKKTNPVAKNDIAKQVYEDSEINTYVDTKKMYDSGKSSDFKGGYVTIRTPYVRLRYYIGGKANSKHPTGIPQWFEKTKKENMNKYIQLYNKIFNQVKGG
jgi:hypothetical protein